MAELPWKSFAPVSVWKDEAALEGFVRQQPHRQAMIGLRRYMGDSAFARWKLNGAAVPPRWRRKRWSIYQGMRATEYRSIQRRNTKRTFH